MTKSETLTNGLRKRRLPNIRTAGLLASLALIVAACGGTTTSTETGPATTGSTAAPASSTTASTVPVTPPIDAEILISQNCSACHGADLEGGFGPALKGGHGDDHDTEELIEVITNGRNGMPAWGGVLSADEIAAIVAYLEELNAHD